MIKEKTAEEVPAGVPSDSGFETHSPMCYRVAVGPTGDHGYEIGYWPAGANPSNPSEFKVVEAIYGQEAAAQRTAALNASWMTGEAPAPHEEAAVAAHDEDDDEDDDAPHKRAARHRPRYER